MSNGSWLVSASAVQSRAAASSARNCPATDFPRVYGYPMLNCFNGISNDAFDTQRRNAWIHGALIKVQQRSTVHRHQTEKVTPWRMRQEEFFYEDYMQERSITQKETKPVSTNKLSNTLGSATHEMRNTLQIDILRRKYFYWWGMIIIRVSRQNV